MPAMCALFIPVCPSLTPPRSLPLATPTVPRLSPPRRRRSPRFTARAASTGTSSPPPPPPDSNSDPGPETELGFDEQEDPPAPATREEFLAYLNNFPKDPDPPASASTSSTDDVFDEIFSDEDASAPTALATGDARPPLPRNDGLLASLFTYVRFSFSDDIDAYLATPLRVVLASALALLFGVFSATSASTIIGSVADWDPLAAAVLLVWTESFTKYYYRQSSRSRLLQLINAFKIGLIYGMAVDAFKLST